MDDQTEPETDKVSASWQPRFGIRSMLLMMVVFSVMAAAGSYLLRAIDLGQREAQLGFILFTLTAPVILVVLLSLLQNLTTWWMSRR